MRRPIDPFLVMEVMRAADARAAAGGDVLHLEIGQPSTPAPALVRAAAHVALDTDLIGYTEAFGIPALRDRIADHYRTTQGVDLSRDRIAVTVGSSAGFLLAFLAAFPPGARVAMAAPGYPAYRNILTALDLEPVEIPVGPETGWQPTPSALDRLDPAPAGVIIASPANPTGTMASPGALADLALWARLRGAWLVSDEIYHGIVYGAPAVSAVALDDRAIVINSFSKYYSMTGWRLGWMVLPEALVRPVECLAQNLFISPPTLSQRAAIAAFDAGAELDGHVDRYRANRDHLLAALLRAGVPDVAPADGAFYLYADVSRFTNDSVDFCRRLLAETGVAITPGVDFDSGRGRGTVRLAYAGATSTIAEAALRLERFLG